MENMNYEEIRTRRRRAKNYKIAAVVLAMLLLVGCVAGATLAWLTAQSSEVTNIFTTSDINITLVETKGTENGTNREFKMIPGWTIDKDPKVTVTTGSEDCYLFVKIEKSNNFDDFMTYTIAEGWTALDDVDDVYYRIVDTDDERNVSYSILDDDQVIVLDTVTKEQMEAIATSNQPELTVTAYAVQLWKTNESQFIPAEAWDEID